MKMKLWLLRPIENLENDPWNPWYDKAFGFVVRAATEEQARTLANEEAGDENRDAETPWLRAECSTCVELNTEGDAGVILQDFNAA